MSTPLLLLSWVWTVAPQTAPSVVAAAAYTAVEVNVPVQALSVVAVDGSVQVPRLSLHSASVSVVATPLQVADAVYRLASNALTCAVHVPTASLQTRFAASAAWFLLTAHNHFGELVPQYATVAHPAPPAVSSVSPDGAPMPTGAVSSAVPASATAGPTPPNAHG